MTWPAWSIAAFGFTSVVLMHACFIVPAIGMAMAAITARRTRCRITSTVITLILLAVYLYTFAVRGDGPPG